MRFLAENGYLDFRAIREMGYPFNFIIGGRGTGKTYGALRSSIEDGYKFGYMRRTQTQCDIINKPEFSPIRRVCADTGWQITMQSIAKGLSAFVRYEDGDNGKKVLGETLGFTCALSTIANVRGFDASDTSFLIYDEFIPEKGERPIPHEAEKLFNAYETMNRNRELMGEPPLQLFCLANANDQTAPVLEHLRLINRLDIMRKKHQQYWIDPARGILLILLQDSPISAQKADTALYRLTAGSEFAEMALDNSFAYEDRENIVSRPLAEYKPAVVVGELCIYRHKSQRRYYCTMHKSGDPPVYGTSSADLERFRRDYSWLWLAHLEQRIDYEEYLCQVLLAKYLS